MAARRGRRRLWIAGAIRRPGAFTRKAGRAGRTVRAHAAHIIRTNHARHGLRTFRQAVLARTLGRIGGRRRAGRRRRR